MGKCKIETFQTGFCDKSCLMITFTTSSVKRNTLVVFKILVKMKYAIWIVLPSIKRVTMDNNFQNTKLDRFQI